MHTLPNIEQGDLIEYVWYDILIDETGDPSKARLLRRRQFGLYLRTITDVSSGIECIVTASGQDEDEDAVPQSGWQTIPLSLVTEIKRLKKAKKVKNVNVQARRKDPKPPTPDATSSGSGGEGVR